MRMRRRAVPVLAGVLIAAVLAGGGLYRLFASSDTTVTDAPPQRSGASHGPALLAADSRGAIIVSRKGLAGVSRSGSVVWRVPAGHPGYFCYRRCPDIVLSGAVDANSTAPDPAPISIINGRKRVWKSEGLFKQVILAGTSNANLVIAAGDSEGHAWIELRGSEKNPPTKIDVDGYDTKWLTDATGKYAIAATVPNQREAAYHTHWRWFRRDSSGWHQYGAVLQMNSADGCVSPSGTHAIETESEPVRITPAGHRDKIDGLSNGVSQCAISQSGAAILAQNSMTTRDGTQTKICIVDSNLRTTWKHTAHNEASVIANPRRDEFGYVETGPDVLHIVDQQGDETQTVRGVTGARYLADGSLVTVSREGAVHWYRP